jgi:hypothetical protein
LGSEARSLPDRCARMPAVTGPWRDRLGLDETSPDPSQT